MVQRRKPYHAGGEPMYPCFEFATSAAIAAIFRETQEGRPYVVVQTSNPDPKKRYSIRPRGFEDPAVRVMDEIEAAAGAA